MNEIKLIIMQIIFLIILSICAVYNNPAHADCRNRAVKYKFDKLNGYPKGRPGYIVDHVCPLACGGIDNVSNLQYQTKTDSRIKDRWETTPSGCAILCNTLNSTPTRKVFNCDKN